MPESSTAQQTRIKGYEAAQALLQRGQRIKTWDADHPKEALPPQGATAPQAQVSMANAQRAPVPQGGMVQKVAEVGSGILGPIFRNTGLSSYFVEYGKDPTLLGVLNGGEKKNVALNAIEAFNELPTSAAAWVDNIFGTDWYQRVQALETGKFSDMAFKSSTRSAGVKGEMARDEYEAYMNVLVLRNSGVKSLQELARKGHDAAGIATAITSKQQVGDVQYQTTIADPAAVGNDQTSFAMPQKTIALSDQMNYKSDPQVSDPAAARQYLMSVMGLNQTQAEKVVELYMEDASIISDIVGRDNAFRMRANAGMAVDFMQAGVKGFADATLQGASVVLSEYQKGMKNTQDALTLQFNIAKEALMGGSPLEDRGLSWWDVPKMIAGDLILAPMFDPEAPYSVLNSKEYGAAVTDQGKKIDEWTKTGDGAIDAIIRFPVSMNRNGGAVTMTANVGAAAGLGSAAIPVYATLTMLGIASVAVDADVLGDLQAQDKREFDTYGTIGHRAEDYLYDGRNREYHMDDTYRDVAAWQGSFQTDIVNVIGPGIGKLSKTILGTKAGQQIAWHVSPRALTPENGLRYVEESARTSANSLLMGPAQEVSDAFQAIAKKQGLSGEAATLMEAQSEILARKQLEIITKTVKAKNFGEVADILRKKIDDSLTYAEKSLDTYARVERQVGYLKTGTVVESIEQSLGLPVTAGRLSERTGLAGNLRGQGPNVAEANARTGLPQIGPLSEAEMVVQSKNALTKSTAYKESRGVRQALIEKAEAITRGLDETPAFIAQAQDALRKLKNMSPGDERLLQAADMEMRMNGYTMTIGDMQAKGRIRVTDATPELKLSRARLDAQRIATDHADLQGLAGQFATLKAELQSSFRRGSFKNLEGTYLPEMAREVEAAAKKSSTDLYDWLKANKGESFIRDLLRNDMPNVKMLSKFPTREAVLQADEAIRKHLTGIVDTIKKLDRAVDARRTVTIGKQAKALIRSMELSAQKVSKLSNFTSEGRRAVEETIDAAKNMNIALPTSFHAFVADPNAAKTAFVQFVDFAGRVFKPFTTAEARLTVMQKLASDMRRAGYTSQGIIDDIGQVLKLQSDGGIRGGFWKRGWSSPGATVGSVLGGRSKLVDHLANFSETFGKLATKDQLIVTKAMEGALGRTVSGLFQKFYNYQRFYNPRFVFAEIVEQGLATTAREGGVEKIYTRVESGTNTYRSGPMKGQPIPADRNFDMLGMFGDIRVTPDIGMINMTSEEAEMALREIMAVNPEVAKKLKQLGMVAEKSSTPGDIMAWLWQAKKQASMNALDRTIISATRQEMLTVYKGLPEWETVLKKFGSEEGVVKALDEIWIDPNKASLDVKNIVLGELNMSLDSGSIVKAQIELRVRKRLTDSGVVASSNMVMNTLNNPLLLPFFRYNWKTTKLALKVFTGHGFGVRYGMGLMYLYDHFSDMSSFDSKKFQREYPETSRLLQYILIPANPTQWAPGLGIAASALAGENTDPRSMIVDGIIRKGVLNPLKNGFTSVVGSAEEVMNGVQGLKPTSGRAQITPTTKSPFLQATTGGT